MFNWKAFRDELVEALTGALAVVVILGGLAGAILLIAYAGGWGLLVLLILIIIGPAIYKGFAISEDKRR